MADVKAFSKFPGLPVEAREYFKKSGFSMIPTFNGREYSEENSLDFLVHISGDSYNSFKKVVLEVYSMMVYEKGYPVVPVIITLNGAARAGHNWDKAPKVFCNLVIDPLDDEVVNMVRSLVEQKKISIYYYDEYLRPIAIQEHVKDDVLTEGSGMLHLMNNIREARMQGKLSRFANFDMAAEKFYRVKPKQE